jgi:hypothetical protein
MESRHADAVPRLPQPGEERLAVRLATREYSLTARHQQRWTVRRAQRTVAELIFTGGAYRALVPGRSIAPSPDWRFVVEQL